VWVRDLLENISERLLESVLQSVG